MGDHLPIPVQSVGHARLLYGIGAAIMVIAGLAALDAWIATPLRAISSMIAGMVLEVAGLPVERTGTILATLRFRFDVVPACSGSTILRVLLALAVVWCVIQPRLHGWRLVIAVALAVPLALVANGLRVAALVATGDALLHPVEGWAHDLIGVATFIIACGSLLVLTDRLASDSQVRSVPPWLKPLAVMILAGILALPVVAWAMTSWAASPLDRYGWIFMSLGVMGTVVAWRRSGEGAGSSVLSPVLSACGLLTVIVGRVVDVHAMQAIGLVGAAVGMAGWMGGRKNMMAIVPFLVVSMVGLPIAGFTLTRLMGWSGPEASLVLRSLVAALAGMIGVVVLWRWPRTSQPLPCPTLSVWFFGVALAATLLLSLTGGSSEPLRLETSYLQGDWVGQDLTPEPAALAVLGEERLHTRAYRDSKGRQVNLIITTTGGQRHNAHPPEYCMTGAGWSLESNERAEVILAKGEKILASRSSFRKGNDICDLVYWFTDGSQSVATFAGMLARDGAQRLSGDSVDWALVRVVGNHEAAWDFLKVFTPAISSSESP